MKKLIFTSVMAFVTFTTAIMTVSARQLTAEEALGRLGTAPGVRGIGSKTIDIHKYRLAYTSRKDGLNTYYAFNESDGGGFMVLSADDRLPAVFMVSDEGASFDMARIPDNMKWWLSEYDNAVTRCVKEGRLLTTQASREPIAPLLGNTQWSQMTPYNNYCPSQNGDRALTGCVATAMAQIMRKWQYPSKGTGKKKYDYEFEWSEGSVVHYIAASDSTDFSSHTYDWDNMLDSYTGEYSQSQADAVATLMHDCGVAASMAYGNYGSTAGNRKAVEGMVEYFGYDASATVLPREAFSDPEWEAMVYGELAAGRPVLYSGRSSADVGHTFVCDGYNEGRYHMNWGAGSANCYSLLVSTTPEEPAISVVNSKGKVIRSFDEDQMACFNLKPDEGGTIDERMKVVCTQQYATGVFDETSPTYFKEQSTFTRYDDMCLKGMFLISYTHKYALGIKASNSSQAYYIQALSEEMRSGEALAMYGSGLSDILTPGTYTITPVYKDLTAGDSEWKEMTMSSSIVKPTITISEFTPETKPYLQIISEPVISTTGGVTTPDNQVYMKNGVVDLSLSINVKAVNDVTSADYYLDSRKQHEPHHLLACICDNDTWNEVATMQSECGDMPSGTTQTFHLSLRDTGGSGNMFKVGKKYFIMFYETYRIVSSTINYTEETLPDRKNISMPDTKYQSITFTVVESDPTGIESIAEGNASADRAGQPRKEFKNGRIVIIKNGKEYSVDGRKIK